MTHDEINHAIAMYVCGWTLYPPDQTHAQQWLNAAGNIALFHTFSPSTSLDDCAIAFRLMQIDTQRRTAGWLSIISMPVRILINAPNALVIPPLQRCEAMLRAVGKWEET